MMTRQAQAYLRRIEASRPQTAMGHLSQMAAGLTHRVTAARLATIARAVPALTIVTGDEDHLVDPRNSEWMAKQMPVSPLRAVMWHQHS